MAVAGLELRNEKFLPRELALDPGFRQDFSVGGLNCEDESSFCSFFDLILIWIGLEDGVRSGSGWAVGGVEVEVECAEADLFL